jgi:osmoprotectant transport system permease protein
LALIADQLLALIESGVAKRRRWRIAAGCAVLLAGVIAAAFSGSRSQASVYVVGAKSFSEQYILSALIAQQLEEQGASATRRVGLGSAIAFRALVNDDIDVYVDYSGTVWTNYARRRDMPSRQVLLQELREWLREEHGALLLGTLGFENAYALAMRRERAEELGIASIADLAAHAASLSIGGDFEFFARPEWRALQDRYGLQFAANRQYQSTFMYKAVAGGEVDVISAFSSDGRIAAEDLVVLADTLQVIPPYDAIVLIAPGRAADPLLRRALEPLLGSIPVERMREANLMVDRDEAKLTPPQAARWLAAQAER